MFEPRLSYEKYGWFWSSGIIRGQFEVKCARLFGVGMLRVMPMQTLIYKNPLRYQAGRLTLKMSMDQWTELVDSTGSYSGLQQGLILSRRERKASELRVRKVCVVVQVVLCWSSSPI